MKRLLFVLLPLLFFEISCKKFLDHKPYESEYTVEYYHQLQLLLNNTKEMNLRSPSGYSELIADNYFIKKSDYDMYFSRRSNRYIRSEIENYTWKYEALASDYYWEAAYQHSIHFANIVLDELQNLDAANGNIDSSKSIRGQALFYRAFTFINLAQLFCRPWSEFNADSLGIVQRLSGSVNHDSRRYKLRHMYETIIGDLESAALLLPGRPAIATQPSKAAAYAALARTYLSRNEYIHAAHYAGMALQYYPELMDYNNIASPVSTLNAEVIFHSTSPTFAILNKDVHRIDSTLYNYYDANDLRKTVFFKQHRDDTTTYYFQGSYDGDALPSGIFDGLATDEMYLVRAESAARQGKIDSALLDLNALLVKRWKQGTYTAFASTDANEIIDKILLERRKELVWRGLRWSDIRRLNVLQPGIKLERKVGNTLFELLPNSLTTIMLLPDAEVSLGGVPQNSR